MYKELIEKIDSSWQERISRKSSQSAINKSLFIVLNHIPHCLTENSNKVCTVQIIRVIPYKPINIPDYTLDN